MQPGQFESLLQRVGVGKLPQALFVMGQGLAPAPLAFQFLAALQVAVDLDRPLGESDRGGAGCWAAAGARRKASAANQRMSCRKGPSSHDVVRGGLGTLASRPFFLFTADVEPSVCLRQRLVSIQTAPSISFRVIRRSAN